ncbi:MAG: hypothetical protein KBC84_01870 [Proteobacteria bacterium]|nr:hypothetical protein [Pseudomonadota bacterium]
MRKILAGFALVIFSTLIIQDNAYAFDTAVIDWAIGELCGHITHHLGGLLVTVAGFGAIVAAAFGSYRVAYSAIITAVGAFAVSTILSLYFKDAASKCGAGAGNNGGNGADRSAIVQTLNAESPNLENESSKVHFEPNRKIDPFTGMD